MKNLKHFDVKNVVMSFKDSQIECIYVGNRIILRTFWLLWSLLQLDMEHSWYCYLVLTQVEKMGFGVTFLTLEHLFNVTVGAQSLFLVLKRRVMRPLAWNLLLKSVFVLLKLSEKYFDIPQISSLTHQWLEKNRPLQFFNYLRL